MITLVAGVDPSLASTGIARANDERMAVTTKASDPSRLDRIYAAVKGAAEQSTLVVIEDLPKNAKSAGLTGMAQGVVRLAIRHGGAEFIAISPASIKKAATGNGTADKPMMRQAWLEYAGEDVKQNDIVDALWMREVGRYLAGQVPAWRPEVSCVDTFKDQVDAIVSGWELS